MTGFALSVEEFTLADLAGVIAAGVEFAVVTALLGAGGLATHPNNISRLTWTANSAFTDSPKLTSPLIRQTITQLSAFRLFLG